MSSSDPLSIIEIQELHFSREKPIFKGLNLSIKKHDIVGIMGPSGTGKTTLLNLIAGQLMPDQGTVCVDGNDLSTLSRQSLFKLRRRMSVLFQGGALFTDYNVFENVAFPLREQTELPEDMIRDLVYFMLEAVGLRGAAERRIDELSGGMARRVALARAVILGPDIMMYDEPFTGQDPIAKGMLLKLIQSLNTALDLTTVLVSHDIHETMSIADYLYIIADGKVVGEGTPEELMETSSDLVKQFLNGRPEGPLAFSIPAPSMQDALLGA